jgi:hypothetical protein
MSLHRASWALALLCLSCTDTGIYGETGGRSAGNKAELSGEVCAPLPSGTAFPVKVIFAMQGGTGIDLPTRDLVVDTLNGLPAHFPNPYLSVAVVAFHTVATAEISEFVPPIDSAVFSTGVERYKTYQESGPIWFTGPLKLSKSLISGDMDTACRGDTARGRYLVLLMVFNADDSCNNAAFNADVEPECNDLLNQTPPDPRGCALCEVRLRTQAIRALGAQSGADVRVQPIFVTTAAGMMGPVDPAVQAAREEVLEIAAAGDTTAMEVDPSNLDKALLAVDYSPVKRTLTLKRLIAFNRNALARDGHILVDSDGDGISDDDEKNRYHTDPTKPDTDGDLINDGIEVKFGMNPLAKDVINGCNPLGDADEDRLNDCEERVLGTDPCMEDTDGDGLPDLVELNAGTNPLVAEDLKDDDGDGRNNVDEVLAHTDPNSADIAFGQENGYVYSVDNAAPVPSPDQVDAPACYPFDASNITLVDTLERPDGVGGITPAGSNDVYVYAVTSPLSDARGGISSLFVQQYRLNSPASRTPRGVVKVTPDDFVLGH